LREEIEALRKGGSVPGSVSGGGGNNNNKELEQKIKE